MIWSARVDGVANTIYHESVYNPFLKKKKYQNMKYSLLEANNFSVQIT